MLNEMDATNKTENEAQTTAPSHYINYDVFDPELIPLDEFYGPKAGEKAPDFEALTTNGKLVSLSDFFGRSIILEMGSYTCPMYNGDVEAMNSLQMKYPDAVFIVLYIREAHPGEKITGHHSVDDKIALAKKVEGNIDENRLVLVDTITGDAHRLYGALPNSVHVINPKGLVAIRLDWNNVPLVDRILAELKTDDDATLPFEHFPKKPPMLSRNGIPVLLRGGRRAIWDMVVAIPGMIMAHKKAAAAFPGEKTFRR